jgi:O-antigen/teichoic acid export membrane protein
MSALKNLLGQTAVYGLSSIVGRLLNYLLVPLYTYTLPTGEYGVVTELYSYVALLFAFLTYGMETTFFRFSETEKASHKVKSTASFSLLISTILFLGLAWIFRRDLAQWIGYENHQTYVSWFIMIVGLDVLSSIPFAWLRQQNKAMKFAVYKLVNISVNLGLNLFFILYCPAVLKSGEGHLLFSFVSSFFDGQQLVQYIFISNLAASAVTLIMLLPVYASLKFGFDTDMWKRMMPYALPILVVNIAGLVPISMDKILLPDLFDGSSEEAMKQLGIYGANAKIAVIMLLFIQTFRYAADPFFFSEADKKDAKKTYAKVMHWFVIFGSFIFLTVMLFLDVIQYFVGSSYREGLYVVPVLLMGNLCLGIYYNLSFWYKLTNKTIYGAWFSIAGAAISIALNFILVPKFGIMGSAWSVFAAYFVPMLLSFYFSSKHYPIPYNVWAIIAYPTLVIAFYFFLSHWNLHMIWRLLFMLVFTSLVVLFEMRRKTFTN